MQHAAIWLIISQQSQIWGGGRRRVPLTAKIMLPQARLHSSLLLTGILKEIRRVGAVTAFTFSLCHRRLGITAHLGGPTSCFVMRVSCAGSHVFRERGGSSGRPSSDCRACLAPVLAGAVEGQQQGHVSSNSIFGNPSAHNQVLGLHNSAHSFGKQKCFKLS